VLQLTVSRHEHPSREQFKNAKERPNRDCHEKHGPERILERGNQHFDIHNDYDRAEDQITINSQATDLAVLLLRRV
jgi:hypothetical protein